jgi:hypothetical protein
MFFWLRITGYINGRQLPPIVLANAEDACTAVFALIRIVKKYPCTLEVPFYKPASLHPNHCTIL